MSADQKILNGKGWANNPETNNAKNKLVRTYFRTDQGKNLFENPLIINSGKNAGRTAKEKIEVFPVWNHDEADTRLIFHARVNIKAAVLVTKDADVFLVLI